MAIKKKKTERTSSAKLSPGFNPVKNDTSESRASKVVWSTQAIDIALDGLNQGFKLKQNPFYENNTKLLKADLLFDRTPEEIEQYKKCMNNVIEFAKECQLMTPEGIRHVTLRDYQEEYLEHLQNNRLSIFLSCRQSGKCFYPVGRVDIDITKILQSGENILSADTLKKWDKNYYYLDVNKYSIPVFELYNLFATGWKWRLKYHLYKLIFILNGWKERNERRKAS